MSNSEWICRWATPYPCPIARIIPHMHVSSENFTFQWGLWRSTAATRYQLNTITATRSTASPSFTNLIVFTINHIICMTSWSMMCFLSNSFSTWKTNNKSYIFLLPYEIIKVCNTFGRPKQTPDLSIASLSSILCYLLFINMIFINYYDHLCL